MSLAKWFAPHYNQLTLFIMSFSALALIAHTQVKNFQLATEQVPARKRTSSRTNSFTFESLKTLRFKMIARAGRVVNASGRSMLKMAGATFRERRYERI